MTSLLLTIQPVGSVALAALIFGESPSSLQLVGVAIVLAAVVGATRPARRAPAIRAAASNNRYAIAGASGSRCDRGLHVLLGELRILELAGQERVVGAEVEVPVARQA